MYDNKRVRDYMVPVKEYPVIYEDYTAAEAFSIMRESFHQKDGTWYGFQSLLVINDREELVGILTLRSLLKAFKIQAMLDHLLKGDPMGLFFMPRFHNSLQIVTKDIMRPLSLITVQEDCVIFEAIVTMVKWKINSLPVMSGKELVGIVRTIDLFWSVGEFLE
ncbi:CBS domain-containing protein [Desulfotomaculum arcticum]|uniref:CBS domain-containing protein n=1 Tax=Desulfotruncus arcticus DSM 17038 TaxID=1121424 RepID=A0A1I2NCS0_9FIRM|nr:CBS domain-containing protein [Desulfotruncus arcticus]SFG01725.1 CBS domain-containing protein [Desulfotomaculum arcticum] [Desulfotruncus arcticus DSM 17038]